MPSPPREAGPVGPRAPEGLGVSCRYRSQSVVRVPGLDKNGRPGDGPMSDEVVIALFTLAGVAVGSALTSGLTYLADRRLWRRTQALATRLLLAETYAHIWDVAWSDARLHLERLRAHLEILGVSEDRFDALLLAVRRCRSYIDKQREERSFDPDYGPGLTYPLANEYNKAEKAIVAELMT